jgi:hypothetical protein
MHESRKAEIHGTAPRFDGFFRGTRSTFHTAAATAD